MSETVALVGATRERQPRRHAGPGYLYAHRAGAYIKCGLTSADDPFKYIERRKKTHLTDRTIYAVYRVPDMDIGERVVRRLLEPYRVRLPGAGTELFDAGVGLVKQMFEQMKRSLDQMGIGVTESVSVFDEQAMVSTEKMVMGVLAEVDRQAPFNPTLRLAHQRLDAPRRELGRPVSVAVVGESGSGKSSLINSLLGPHLLPTYFSRACTAVPISLGYRGSPGFDVRVVYFTRGEFFGSIEYLLDLLGDPDMADGAMKELSDLIQAHGVVQDIAFPDMDEALGAYPDAAVAAFRAALLRGEAWHVASVWGTTAASSHAWVDDAADVIKRHGSAVYPMHQLVKEIQVSANITWLKDMRVIDLPGTKDQSFLRSRAHQDYMSNSDHVLIITPGDRIQTNAAVPKVIRQNRGRIVCDGRCDSMTCVATKVDADSMSRRELQALSRDYGIESTMEAVRDLICRETREGLRKTLKVECDIPVLATSVRDRATVVVLRDHLVQVAQRVRENRLSRVQMTIDALRAELEFAIDPARVKEADRDVRARCKAVHQKLGELNILSAAARDRMTDALQAARVKQDVWDQQNKRHMSTVRAVAKRFGNFRGDLNEDIYNAHIGNDDRCMNAWRVLFRDEAGHAQRTLSATVVAWLRQALPPDHQVPDFVSKGVSTTIAEEASALDRAQKDATASGAAIVRELLKDTYGVCQADHGTGLRRRIVRNLEQASARNAAAVAEAIDRKLRAACEDFENRVKERIARLLDNLITRATVITPTEVDYYRRAIKALTPDGLCDVADIAKAYVEMK